MRRLILFRHAKTEPYAETGLDEQRALTERGISDAANMANRLKGHGVTPNTVRVSTARRTRQTWSHAQPFFTSVTDVAFDEDLYLAEPEDIVSVISRTNDAETFMVIGHNPGLHDLALMLTEIGGARDQDAAARLRVKYPTSGVAVFAVKEPDPFSIYNFELEMFLTPKD